MVGTPRTGVADKPASMWVLGIKPGCLEGHQVLLAAESPPAPGFNVFICLFM